MHRRPNNSANISYSANPPEYDLIFVIDVSNEMKAEFLKDIRIFIQEVVRNFNPKSRIGVMACGKYGKSVLRIDKSTNQFKILTSLYKIKKQAGAMKLDKCLRTVLRDKVIFR